MVIGRYISENYNGTALHPIDFMDISTGQLVSEVMDPNITTISPVNKLHPRDDVLATGSSRFALCSHQLHPMMIRGCHLNFSTLLYLALFKHALTRSLFF